MMDASKSSRKKRVFLMLAVVVLGIGGLVFFMQSRPENIVETQVTQEAASFDPPGACDILTIEDAQKAIGEQAQKPEDNNDVGASSDDIEVSQCLFQTPITNVDAVKSQKTVSLLVRGAKNETGAKSNSDVFTGALKPEGVVDIDGYGQAAFWNPQFGQLNILKSDNWYILSVGSINPAEKKLEDAKKLAEAIQESL